MVRAALQSRADLASENLARRQQLAILKRPTRKRPRLRFRDWSFWIVVRAVHRDWRRHLVLVRPEILVRWHRQAWRLIWRCRLRGRVGRPRLSAEVRALIATMARDYPAWGSERIRGELLKLGHDVSATTIRATLRRHRVPPAPQCGGLAWPAFLRTQARGILACDSFTVETLFLKTVYVFFIDFATRRVHLADCTRHPTAAWATQQARQLSWGLQDGALSAAS